MANLERIAEFRAAVASNPFAKQPLYTVTLANFHDLSKTLGAYRKDASEMKLPLRDFLAGITPDFQRSNTCWARDQQQRFIENLLAGYKTEIFFYSSAEEGEELYNCYLLDGLQRMTAIDAFQRGEFTIYGGFSFEEINHRLTFKNLRLTMRAFHFATHREACEHYIAMNEGITHNEDDIATAYEYLEGCDG